MEVAARLFLAGDVAAAEAAFGACLARCATAEGHANRGACRARLGDHEGALQDYGAALLLEPGQVEALHNSGIALTGLRRHAEALDAFQRVLRVAPAFFPSLCGQAEALSSLERWEEAGSAGMAAAAVRPDDAEVALDAGFAYSRAGRWEDAIGALERGAEAAVKAARPPGGASRRAAVGVASRGSARTAAEEQAATLLAAALAGRAGAREGAGELAGARVDLARAIGLAPTAARHYNAGRLAWGASGGAAEAEAAFRAALTLDPHHARAGAALASCLLSRSAWDEAEALLERLASASVPPSPELVYNLGYARLKGGRAAASIAAFERALALSAPEPFPQAAKGLALARAQTHTTRGRATTTGRNAAAGSD